MAHYKPRTSRRDKKGELVTIYQDLARAWYVGRPGDHTTHPTPMGAFISEEAARQWADRRFPGDPWPGKARTEAPGLGERPLPGSEPRAPGTPEPEPQG